MKIIAEWSSSDFMESTSPALPVLLLMLASEKLFYCLIICLNQDVMFPLTFEEAPKGGRQMEVLIFPGRPTAVARGAGFDLLRIISLSVITVSFLSMALC